MKDFQPSQIRNIALVSQHGTGKTSLAESLLFRTKAITRHGKIEDGTTALDFTPEEIHRKITISLALAPVEWTRAQLGPRQRGLGQGSGHAALSHASRAGPPRRRAGPPAQVG